MPAIELDKRQAAETPVEEPNLIEAETAFLVFRTKEGAYGVSGNINIPLTVEKEPTLTDIKAALYTTLSDLTREETAILAAQHVYNMQMQLVRQSMNEQLNQQVLNKVKL